jgi:hypothetical protein
MEQPTPRFYSWISKYYIHPKRTRKARDPAELNTIPLPFPPPPCVHTATLDVNAPEMLVAVSCPGAIRGSEMLLHGVPLALAFEQTRRILFDPNAGRTLPRCKVVIVWGENTLREMVGAAWAVEKLYKHHKETGKAGRLLSVKEMPRANHFVRLVHFQCLCKFGS